MTDNPFVQEEKLQGKLKALLIFGLHSYGTIAAAKAISNPNIASNITKAILASYHQPPYLLENVEVVIKATVTEDGRLDEPSPDDIEFICINGRFTIKGNQGSESKICMIKATTINPPNREKANSFKIAKMEYKKSEKATPMTDEKKVLLTDEFFNFFSKRSLIVISPHGDDSAIACGGLVYYLRNENLWKEKSKHACPPVDILVMTKSTRGVKDDYMGEYCFLLNGSTDRDKIETTKSDIRYNESMAESNILGSNMHWMDLGTDSDKEKDNDNKVINVIKDILCGNDNLLCTLDQTLTSELSNDTITPELRSKLKDEKDRVIFPNEANISKKPCDKWIFDNDTKFYKTEEGDSSLNVYKYHIPLFLIPRSSNQHPTHKYCIDFILKFMREKMKHHNVEIWEYDSPWSTTEPYNINVICRRKTCYFCEASGHINAPISGSSNQIYKRCMGEKQKHCRDSTRASFWFFWRGP